MAGDITLGVRLTADAKGFVGEVKLSKAELAKLGIGAKKAGAEAKTMAGSLDTAERSSGKLRGAISGVTKALVAGGLILAVRQIITSVTRWREKSEELADSIDKVAKVSGFSAARLQELRFAADQTGVGADRLDDGLTRLNRRLGLFIQDGGGPAAAAFERLGLAADISTGRLQGADRVFDVVVRRLANVENAAERSALASQIFGEDAGPKLVLLLDQGTVGLRRYADMARDMGLVVGGDAVQALVDMKDKLDAAQQAIDAQIARATEAWIPALRTTATLWQEFQRDFFGTLEGIGERLFGDLSAEQIEAKIAKIDRALAGFREHPDLFKLEIEGLEAEREDLAAQLSALRRTAALGMADAEASLRQAAGAAKDAFIELTRDTPPPEVAAAPGAPQKPPFRGPGAGDTEAGLRFGRRFSGLEEEFQRRLEAASPAARIEAELRRLKALQLELGKSAAEMKPLYDDLWSSMEAGADRVSDAAADLAHVVGTAFEDAILRGEKLRDVFAGLLQDLARVVLRQTVTKPLQDLLGSVVGGIFHAGGVVGADLVPQRLISAAALAGAPSFAGGGVMGIGPTEAPAILHQGEGVFTPAQMRALGERGRPGPFYIDARGADRHGLALLAQAFRQLNASFDDRAVTAVANASRRTPGLFGRR